MKQSRIRRLIPKKLAREIATAGGGHAGLEKLAADQSAEVVAKMRAKGYELVTRLENGEGVFVRDEQVVGLHVQLPSALYRKLDAECRRREISKRKLVCEALEQHLNS